MPNPSRLRRLSFLLPTGLLFRRAVHGVARALYVPLPIGVSHRFPFVAAFLSLVPGLGQIYNHQPRKTPYFVLSFIAILAVTIRFITTPYLGNILVLATISVVMASYSDALISAAAINGQYFTLRNKLAAFTYPFFLLGMLHLGKIN